MVFSTPRRVSVAGVTLGSSAETGPVMGLTADRELAALPLPVQNSAIGGPHTERVQHFLFEGMPPGGVFVHFNA
jgi:hypothetical protein